MDLNEEQDPALTNNWNPNVEDGVDSVDGDPEERAAEAGGAPEARGEGNTGEHAPETGRAPGKSRGRARHAIIRDGPPPDSEWNSERHHGHQVENPTHQCANVECTKGRQFLHKENRKKDTIIRRLERELKKKQEELDRKNRGPERQTERTWPERLREAAAQGDDADAQGEVARYAGIYKLSCHEENMSPKTIHPALAFKKPTPALVDREARACVDRANRKAEDASTLKDLVLNPSKPRRFLEYRFKYSFDDLPEAAQRRIFQLVFSYPDRLVHAISRLDQHMEPADVPPVHGRRSGLLNRFHITGKQGGRRCSLNYAMKGNDLLAPLLVSRKFLFLGAHAFYGRNTFAFSSLGKLGRFCVGIGAARRQRLQHIEFLWIGNQKITSEGHDRRTWVLASLCEMPRLRSLTIYIDESNVRRKSENIVTMAYLAKKTSGQPNFRMTRDLRTVHGMDYVRQIRGLRVLKVLDHKTCDPVRDWSFTLDLQTTCKRDKPYPEHDKSKLQNLLPLPRRFAPTEWEWEAAKSHYDLTWLPETEPENDFPDAAGPAAPAPGPVEAPGPAASASGPVDARPAAPDESVAAPCDVRDAGDLGIGPGRGFGDPMNIPESTVAPAPTRSPAPSGGIPQRAGSPDVEMMDVDDAPQGVVDPSEIHNPHPNAEGGLGDGVSFEDLSARLRDFESAPSVRNQPRGFEQEDRLFVEGSDKLPADYTPVFNHDEDHDEDHHRPLDPLSPGTRDQSVKDEEGMFVGADLDVLEREPSLETNVDAQGNDGQGGVGYDESSLGSFEMQQSQEEERPRLSGCKRPPAYGSKRPPTTGGKHPPFSAPSDGDISTRDEESSSTELDESSDEERSSQARPRPSRGLKHPPWGYKRPPTLPPGDGGSSTSDEGDPASDLEKNYGEEEDMVFDKEHPAEDGVDERFPGDGITDGNTGEAMESIETESNPPNENDSEVTWGDDTEFHGCSPPPGEDQPASFSPLPDEREREIKGTSTSQGEQSGSPVPEHARGTPPPSGGKKRHGEDLSPGREKRARNE